MTWNALLTARRTFGRQVIEAANPNTCAANPNCLSDKMPLLKNVRTGLIDPDTPKTAYSKTSNDGEKLTLVVSGIIATEELLTNMPSFLMNLIPMGELSMEAMIHTSKR